ncbi:hypothetical protein D5b_00489 [Faustovirus]|nr:hypothetical protein D5b_00489 [Faustovirus]AMN84431.1 hypothetical protein D6_00019 [Faustovirus]AMP44427.1 hypothetical protein PRJ_Dakar_00477 [Faustovirus]
MKLPYELLFEIATANWSSFKAFFTADKCLYKMLRSVDKIARYTTWDAVDMSNMVNYYACFKQEILADHELLIHMYKGSIVKSTFFRKVADGYVIEKIIRSVMIDSENKYVEEVCINRGTILSITRKQTIRGEILLYERWNRCADFYAIAKYNGDKFITYNKTLYGNHPNWLIYHPKFVY